MTDRPGPDDDLRALADALFADAPEQPPAAAAPSGSPDEIEHDLFAGSTAAEAGDAPSAGAGGGDVDLFAAIPDVVPPVPAPRLEDALPGFTDDVPEPEAEPESEPVAAAAVAAEAPAVAGEPASEPEGGPEAEPEPDAAAEVLTPEVPAAILVEIDDDEPGDAPLGTATVAGASVAAAATSLAGAAGGEPPGGQPAAGAARATAAGRAAPPSGLGLRHRGDRGARRRGRRRGRPARR